MTAAGRLVAIPRSAAREAAFLLLALACAPAYRPPAGEGAARVPIRDRYADARIELLDAINDDRRSGGLDPVALDSVATIAAQAQAEAMAVEGFFSHYGTRGDAPYERLAEAGGTAHVLENLFRLSVSGSGRGDPWAGFDVRSAEAWLMASPGHRATILDPGRTGVGLGIAVDESRGTVYVVQDFIARQVAIEAPRRAWRGAPVEITGRAIAPGVRPLLVVLRREPARRSWAGAPPPGGSYPDGVGEATIVPPWSIEWRRTDRSFSVALPIGRATPAGRIYGIVYVAGERTVLRAIDRRSAWTTEGWPGAAFVVDLF